jgi:UDP-N-acetylmuramoyl-L-alanyl-D-glutamate--2,6-diaminopimelate ligase
MSVCADSFLKTAPKRRAMKLRELAGLGGQSNAVNTEVDILAVTEDSRRVSDGSLFCAVSGGRSDGHEYADAAAAAGAVAILGDRPGVESLAGLPYLYSAHPREAEGLIAHALQGDPSKEMFVVGVTGTNGKSSVVVLVHHILRAFGYRASCLGTLGYAIGETIEPAPHTTPFGEDLANLLKRARDAWGTHVVMEVSSHALDQERVAGIQFDAASFTNLTQDHLDYHGDMRTYADAKVKLFERVDGDDAFTVVNLDDRAAQAFIDASSVPCYTFGRRGEISAEDVVLAPHGLRFTAVTPWGQERIESPLIGNHNLSNLLNVIAICGGIGMSIGRIAQGLSSARCVPGRFELIDAGQDFWVVVDYAHTEDGLRNVLQAAREICQGRLITVFGCGGDRDRTKRPLMAAAVAQWSDVSILTSDNPRTEDPQQILDDTEVGMTEAGKSAGPDYIIIADRHTAINEAVAMAEPGDLVMIAGKGHEDYQILGAERIHFDDREEALAALEAR